MRKLLRKKVKFFGKEISVFLVALIAVAAIGMAALVPYLSGLVIGIVTVNQPLELTIDGTATTWNVDAENAFDPITQNFVLVNNAGTDIYAIVETNITGIDDGQPVAFSETPKFGEEFEYFKIGIEIPQAVCEAAPVYGTWDAGDEYCYWDANTDEDWTGVIGGVYYVQIGDGTSPITDGSTMNGRMKFQFKIDVAPATYTFNTQALTVGDATDLA